jgi:hypothetical protein
MFFLLSYNSCSETRSFKYTNRIQVVDGTEVVLTEMGCEDGMWMELAQDRVQWWVLVLAVLNVLQIILPDAL